MWQSSNIVANNLFIAGQKYTFGFSRMFINCFLTDHLNKRLSPGNILNDWLISTC
jgi:hypothetical protein